MLTIETFAEFVAVGEAAEGLEPVWLAAIQAGVSRQRMSALVEQGRIPAWRFYGCVWVSCGAVEKFARQERRVGRPRKGCEAATVRLPLTGAGSH